MFTPLQARFRIAFCIAALGFVSLTLVAQERPQPAVPQHSTAGASHEDRARESQQDVAHESREAADQEGEADQIRHADSVKLVARLTGLSVDHAYWLCIALNFLIVLGVIWFLVKKNVPGVFRNRSDAIRKGMEEARKASEDAQRRLAEVEERLGRLNSEIAQIRAEADEAAQVEEQRIRSSAEEERRRIVSSAEQEITAAANAARRELRAYTAGLAVDLAEKRIKVAPATDEQLVREFTSRMGKDGN